MYCFSNCACKCKHLWESKKVSWDGRNNIFVWLNTHLCYWLRASSSSASTPDLHTLLQLRHVSETNPFHLKTWHNRKDGQRYMLLLDPGLHYESKALSCALPPCSSHPHSYSLSLTLALPLEHSNTPGQKWDSTVYCACTVCVCVYECMQVRSSVKGTCNSLLLFHSGVVQPSTFLSHWDLSYFRSATLYILHTHRGTVTAFIVHILSEAAKRGCLCLHNWCNCWRL